MVPVLTGLVAVGAFLVLSASQGQAEDAVRRTLTIRAATQQAVSALDDVESAQWSEVIEVPLPMPAGGLRAADAAWDQALARLRALSEADPATMKQLDTLEQQFALWSKSNERMVGLLARSGTFDLSTFVADPSVWVAYYAPKRTLEALAGAAEKKLTSQTTSAAAGRRRLQVAVPAVTVLGLIASLFLALAYGRRLGKRIVQAERNARRLARGEPLETVGRSHDEVGLLSEALDDAATLLASRETDLRATKDAAERANHAKSDFLSRMSHELRTPMNSVLGFGQLLALSDLAPDDRDGVEKILGAGRHLLSLIDDVLDVSRIEAGAMDLSIEPVSLECSVSTAVDLVQPMANARSVRITWDPEAFRGRHALGDARRFNQVLLNLLSNAVKYNVDAGEITVGIDSASDGPVRIHVSDTGRGISAEQIGRLFTPFERLGAERAGIEGTGLGLAVSQRLMEAMQGSIEIESVVGAGSTFTVELPQGIATAPPTSAPIPTTPATTDRTVLYIEDNLSNLRLVERLLALRPGVKLISAMQGRLGLELARQHRPNLVLLDLHLPDILGDEVLRRLREDPRTADVPVVIISADATGGRASRFGTDVSSYITKPLDVTVFLETIDRFLGDPTVTESPVAEAC